MAPSERLPPTFDELLTQFRGLLDAHRAAPKPERAGDGNLRCEQCLDCQRCRFCVQCLRCADCSNCELCQDCRGCTRSRYSRFCAGCSYVEYSEGCEDSQYLVLCLDCSSCTQCFACVGLRGQEFCILNQRYSRRDYFPLVQALKKKLEEAIASGLVLSDIAAASHGLWPPRPGDAQPAAASSLPQPADEPPPADSAVDDSDPWAEDAAPERVEGEVPVDDDASAPVVSWVTLPPRTGGV